MSHIYRQTLNVALVHIVCAGIATAKGADDDSIPVVGAPKSRNDARVSWFYEQGRAGLKDATGKVVLPPTYHDVRNFSEGMAAVNIGASSEFPGTLTGGKWGYVDESGALVIPTKYHYAHAFSDGLANLTDPSFEGTIFIDKRGEVQLRVPHGDLGDFREGLAPLYHDLSQSGRGWLTEFINKQGEIAFAVDGYAKEFHEGLAVLSVRGGPAESNEHKSYGFIDKSGAMVIQPQFAEALDFCEGLAAVRTRKTTVNGMGDTWGYIDKTGKYVILPTLNEARPFTGGKAVVHEEGELHVPFDAAPAWKGGTWYLIDKTGKKIGRIEK